MPRLILHEVGPRDGLQVEKQTVPTDKKIEWIGRLLRSGLDIVQVGSFVHPEKVPQMADTDELFRRLVADKAKDDTLRARLSGLVLNERGLNRAFACGVEMICMGVSASETHTQKNTGMGTDEAQRRIIAMGKKAMEAGREVQVSVQSAFGCGFEGPIAEERVLGIVRAYLDAGLCRSAWPTRPGTPTRRRSRACSGRSSSSRPTCSAPATSTIRTASAWRTSTRPWRPA